ITVAETCGNFLARYGILWKPFRLFPATDTASRKCSSIRISYLAWIDMEIRHEKARLFAQAGFSEYGGGTEI
ncbi:hypothetical protein, partial [Shewanella algae]|uniref:hypothetical protein n=1 Tax=Shewanella algae TaxID=38313 RepID=UPI0031F4BD95